MDRQTLITPEYAEQNRLMHEQNGFYGSNGGRYAEHVYGLLATFHPESVLDYGCGKQGLEKTLREMVGERRERQPRVSRNKKGRHRTFQAKMPRWTNYDPAIPGIDTPPREPHDLLICTDVLEHVEPDYIEGTLRTLADLTGKMAFLSFALRESDKTLPDGRNTHLIVQGKGWWEAMAGRHFSYWVEVPWKNAETFLMVAFK